MISTMCEGIYATVMIAQWNADRKPADKRWEEMFAYFRSREIP